MAFKKLFGAIFGGSNGSSAQAQASGSLEYKQFTITPAPIPDGGQFRTAGTISKTQDGDTRSSAFVRADNHTSRDMAVEHSIAKAKQIVDERGDSLLESGQC